MIYIHIQNTVFSDDNRRAFHFFCIIGQNLCTLAPLIDKYHRYPGPHDPCLFTGNFPQSIAQVLHVVKADLRDHTQILL
jgi:hypothetical protein